MTARRSVLAAGAALVAVAVAVALLPRLLPAPGGDRADDLVGSALPPLDRAAAWVNGAALTPDSLAGSPTVVVVWSDTDPRSLDALPEVESWHQAYARYGVRVVGVHAPDFSFGSDPAVAARLAGRHGLTFPIACDPAYRIRSRLGRADALPRYVVADTAGRIVAAGGPGGGEAMDRAIRDQVRLLHPGVRFPATGALPRPPAAEGTPRVVFLGASRAPRGPLAGASPGRTRTYTAQFRFQEEGEAYIAYPVGRWTAGAEGLTAARGGAADFVAVRYDGGRAGAVLGPPGPGRSGRIWILADEAWIGPAARGEDVRADARGATYVDVAEPRLYRIARGGDGRVLKLSPEGPGVTFYSFVFEGRPAAGGARAGAAPR